MQKRTAKRLDLGRALIQVGWIDNGKTLLGYDVNAQEWIAVALDGTLVRELPLPAASDANLQPAFALRDGRRVGVSDGSPPATDFVDVFTGDRQRLVDNGLFLAFPSPDGASIVGVMQPVDASGAPQRGTALGGVFDAQQSCAGAPLADGKPRRQPCLAWDFKQLSTPAGPGSSQPWSPDGKHLLLESGSPCPATGPTPSSCHPEITFVVYSWPQRQLVLTIPAGNLGPEAVWAGNDAIYVRGGHDPSTGLGDYLISLDGTVSPLPDSLHGCCISFSADGRFAVHSAAPGEDCSLFDVSTGAVIAGVLKGPGDTNDTGICQDVSWTPDGRYAIASGVNTP